ncbi:MAG TPA: PCRF domain-containing protein, partial [Sphingomicrobium sp.]
MTGISAERIASIEAKKNELAEAMAAGDLAPDEFVRLSKEYAQIEPVAAAAREVRRLRAELDSLTAMTRDADEEMRAMAEDELGEIQRQLPDAERALAVKLLPRDAADERAA